MVEDPLQFGGAKARVEHHQDGANPHRGEVGFQRHGAVRREDGHAIAGLHAELQQRGCLTFHASAEFGVGEAAVPLNDGSEIAPGVDAARQEVKWCQRGDHELALSYTTKGLYVNYSEVSTWPGGIQSCAHREERSEEHTS